MSNFVLMRIAFCRGVRYGYPWCTRPSTQALLYLVPSKYIFLPSSRAHSSEITLIETGRNFKLEGG